MIFIVLVLLVLVGVVLCGLFGLLDMYVVGNGFIVW